MESLPSSFWKSAKNPAYDAYRNITGLRVMSKLVALPPGTSKDVVDTIAAMKRIAEDPKTQKPSRRRLAVCPCSTVKLQNQSWRLVLS